MNKSPIDRLIAENLDFIDAASRMELIRWAFSHGERNILLQELTEITGETIEEACTRLGTKS